MDQREFWSIVDGAKAASGGDKDAMMEAVGSRLEKGGPEVIAGFQKHLDALQAAMYRWDLWGAAFLMNGGCSDDGFDYWQAWLIAQGRAVCEAAMANPESLADAALSFGEDGDYEFEDFMYVALNAWDAVGGEDELPRESVEGVGGDGPAGEAWEEEELAERWPRLAARFNE